MAARKDDDRDVSPRDFAARAAWMIRAALVFTSGPPRSSRAPIGEFQRHRGPLYSNALSPKSAWRNRALRAEPFRIGNSRGTGSQFTLTAAKTGPGAS